MFKIGDKVKFKKSSIDTGMIDATEDDVFTILYVEKCYVMLKELGSWWSVNHFEHLNEEIMEEPVVENQAIDWEGSQIDWQIGQEVWCTVHGKGEVDRVGDSLHYPVGVVFDNGDTEDYTLCGEVHEQAKRSLFFSEPVITAELFPPKKPFVPKLKKGDVIIYRQRGSSCSYVGVVDYEYHDSVALEDSGDSMYKHAFEFHKLGEEIIFN